MAPIHLYLNFPGHTEEAFHFYRSVFGGEFKVVQRFGETPVAETVPVEARDKIMHIVLPLPGGVMLMGSDALESMGHQVRMGNNMHIAVEAEAREAAVELFQRLSEGGTVTLPMGDAFWNAYFGMTTDRYGIQWMISYCCSRQPD